MNTPKEMRIARSITHVKSAAEALIAMRLHAKSELLKHYALGASGRR